jgi:hypothetical protein
VPLLLMPANNDSSSCRSWSWLLPLVLLDDVVLLAESAVLLAASAALVEVVPDDDDCGSMPLA